jgi:hypothetical protein
MSDQVSIPTITITFCSVQVLDEGEPTKLYDKEFNEKESPYNINSNRGHRRRKSFPKSLLPISEEDEVENTCKSFPVVLELVSLEKFLKIITIYNQQNCSGNGCTFTM